MHGARNGTANFMALPTGKSLAGFENQTAAYSKFKQSIYISMTGLVLATSHGPLPVDRIQGVCGKKILDITLGGVPWSEEKKMRGTHLPLFMAHYITFWVLSGTFGCNQEDSRDYQSFQIDIQAHLINDCMY